VLPMIVDHFCFVLMLHACPVDLCMLAARLESAYQLQAPLVNGYCTLPRRPAAARRPFTGSQQWLSLTTKGRSVQDARRSFAAFLVLTGFLCCFFLPHAVNCKLCEVLFLALCVTLFFFVCESNISGIAQRICAKFRWKTYLVPRADELKCQGQGHQWQKMRCALLLPPGSDRMECAGCK